MKLDFEFACDDDCLDRIVPSDLRGLIAERDRLSDERDCLSMSNAQLHSMVEQAQQDLADQAEALQRAHTELDRMRELVSRLRDGATIFDEQGIEISKTEMNRKIRNAP